MLEPILMIWEALGVISVFCFAFLLKRSKRTKDKYAMFHFLGVVLIAFLVSLGAHAGLGESLHLAWVGRLSIMAIGGLSTWVMYKRPWSVRHTWNREEDALGPEGLFTFTAGLLAAAAFVTSPQVVGLIGYDVDLSTPNWDLPLAFILPFLVLKVADLSGQVPFPVVESPFYFTIEEVRAADWKWTEIQQFNFRLKSSLQEDQHLFSWDSKPWIEAPKSRTLRDIFKLVVQERRKRNDLDTLQDFGDEYAGKPEFCWLFRLRKPWYNPIGWFSPPRLLDPTQRMDFLGVGPYDVIVAERIPAMDDIDPSWLQPEAPEDPNATVLIRR